jgi:hypothetical protein
MPKSGVRFPLMAVRTAAEKRTVLREFLGGRVGGEGRG